MEPGDGYDGSAVSVTGCLKGCCEGSKRMTELYFQEREGTVSRAEWLLPLEECLGKKQLQIPFQDLQKVGLWLGLVLLSGGQLRGLGLLCCAMWD